MKLHNLKTDYLGRNVTFYESIDSTQMEIWRRIENKTIKNGELILCQIQTNGIRDTWKKMAYRRKK